MDIWESEFVLYSYCFKESDFVNLYIILTDMDITIFVPIDIRSKKKKKNLSVKVLFKYLIFLSTYSKNFFIYLELYKSFWQYF